MAGRVPSHKARESSILPTHRIVRTSRSRYSSVRIPGPSTPTARRYARAVFLASSCSRLISDSAFARLTGLFPSAAGPSEPPCRQHRPARYAAQRSISLAAQVQKVRAGIGALDTLHRVGQAGFGHLARHARGLRTPVPETSNGSRAEQRQYRAHATASKAPTRTWASAQPGPETPGRFRSSSVRASSRIASARFDRGTRCSRPPFIRSLGIVQVAASMSNSDHDAPRTSPERAAVRTRNSNASRAGSESLRFPHRPDRVAGLGVMNGPEMPAPVADSRQRRRDGLTGGIVAAIPLRDCPLHDRADTLANAAGSLGLFGLGHIGSRTAITSAVVIVSTGLAPRRGKAWMAAKYRRNDDVHCPADFPPSRHVGLWISITVRAAILDLAQRQRIADRHHHREADHLGRAVEVAEGILHRPTLRIAPARLKPSFSEQRQADQ